MRHDKCWASELHRNCERLARKKAERGDKLFTVDSDSNIANLNVTCGFTPQFVRVRLHGNKTDYISKDVISKRTA